MVLLIDPQEVGDYDVLLYATTDPLALAHWAGPTTDGARQLAVLSFDKPAEPIIQEARDILIGEQPAPGGGPVPLTELRPELKEMAKTYRSIEPASAEPASASVALSPWVWAAGAAVLCAGFYVFYWEPKYRSAY